MSKSIIISERDNIAAVVENGKVVEFFIQRGDILLGDIYLSQVENVLPSIDAAFVNVGSDKMGFLHASDIVGKGSLTQIAKPKQKKIVQVVKEPTGHKGPRVTTSISIPGRFLVLMPYEKGTNVSRKIASAKERARLKSVVSVLKPPGVGVIIRTEAEGQSEAEIQEDLEFLLEKWNSVITVADTVTAPNLLHRDQDLLYKVIREACTEDINEIVLDTPFAYHRAQQLLQSWNITHKINLSVHKSKDSILIAYNIDKEIKTALQTKVNLPCGGYLFIQTTEALSVVDVNSGKFVSSSTQEETIRKTNFEAVDEISRQLRLRNIGGMIIIDFIDMDNRVDKIAVLERLELALEPDKSRPQIGQLSDLGLVELTRHRQGQSLEEIFSKKCSTCSGTGKLIADFNFVVPPQEAEMAAKMQKVKQFKPAQKQKFGKNEPVKQAQNNFQQKPYTAPAKKIHTSPALTAADAHKIKKQAPQQQQKPVVINDEVIKKHLQEKIHLPNISKVIRFSAIPSGIVRKNLGSNYQADVFTILGEIEAVESQIQGAVEQKQPALKEKFESAKKPVVEENKVQTQVKAPVRGGRKPIASSQRQTVSPEKQTASQEKSTTRGQKPTRSSRTTTPSKK